MNSDKKHQIQKQIEQALEKKSTVVSDSYTRSLEQLVEELKVYQQEIEFQNDELRRIQEDLELANQYALSLFDDAPVAYILIDETFQIVKCNKSFGALVRTFIDCNALADFRQFIDPAFQDEFHVFFRQLKRQGTAHFNELKLVVAKDQPIVWVKLQGNRVKTTDDHRIATYRISLTDITTEIEIQNELLKTKKLLEDTSRMARIGSWDKDLDTGNDYWSDIVYEIFEVDSSFVPTMQKSIEFYKDGINREKISRAVIRAVEMNESFDLELQIITANGNEKWVRAVGYPVFQNERCVRLSGTLQDIDATKRNQIALAQSERRLGSVLQMQKEMICRFLPDTTITFANETYRKAFEFDETTIIGKKWLDIIPTHSVPLAKERLQQLMTRPGQMLEYTVEAILAGGRKQWQQWTDYAITDYEGDVIEIQSVGSDITDRIQRERLEKEIEITRNTLKFKQNFLASMSHELRTPLTAIMGVTELIQNTNLDTNQHEMIGTLWQSSINLAGVIDNLLDYSVLETGNVQLQLRESPIEELIDQTREFFKTICHKPIEYYASISHDLPKVINYDQRRIMQVIRNLFINAVKFTESGKIEFALRVQERLQDNKIILRAEVSDTGSGIHTKDIDMLFSPFSKVHEIETDRYKGIGLGLAFCKEVIDLHQGLIGIDSQHGKGTTVWFTFLATEKPAEPRPQPLKVQTESTAPGNNRSLNILLAEDKVVTQKVVSLLLRDMGHGVVIANHGKEALDLFAKYEFDLVLMDIQMPVMDGITATNRLRAQYKNLPPIVALSANVFEGDRQKYISLGMDEYISKPVKRNDFKELFNKLFS